MFFVCMVLFCLCTVQTLTLFFIIYNYSDSLSSWCFMIVIVTLLSLWSFVIVIVIAIAMLCYSFVIVILHLVIVTLRHHDRCHNYDSSSSQSSQFKVTKSIYMIKGLDHSLLELFFNRLLCCILSIKLNVIIKFNYIWNIHF